MKNKIKSTHFVWLLIYLMSSQTKCVASSPFPINFSIPEAKIVTQISIKDKDFASIIPGETTYIFDEEAPYYQDYQRSYFAITKKKGGWDCMRHYEILANGCIPYFIDIDKCHPSTMHFLPKELIKEAMNLEGVSYLKIDHSKFNKTKYYEILNKLLAHTRKYLTTKNMANYLLKTVNYSGDGNILFLSNDPYPDYMRCLTLIGLKEIFQNKIVDFPKIEHIYKNYSGDLRLLYGKGLTYSKAVEDLPVDRENIEQRIKNKEFDLIVYGSIHRGMRLQDLVHQNYSQDKIIYVCGDDYHRCQYAKTFHNLFLREFDAQ